MTEHELRDHDLRDIEEQKPIPRETREQPGLGSGRMLFIAWTLFSALGVWLTLSLAERRAIERCANVGLAWQWTRWSCVTPGGTIILSPELRRATKEPAPADARRDAAFQLQ